MSGTPYQMQSKVILTRLRGIYSKSFPFTHFTESCTWLRISAGAISNWDYFSIYTVFDLLSYMLVSKERQKSACSFWKERKKSAHSFWKERSKERTQFLGEEHK